MDDSPLPLKRLYLVRHGQTDWNLAGRIQGHRPVPLNERGRAQAEILARFFTRFPIAAVWSSDLPRAVETAEQIAAPHGLGVRTTPALRERAFGPLEGMVGDEIEAFLAEGNFATRHEVPGVEEDAAILARVLPVLDEVTKIEGEAVLVTHGGVQRTFLYHLLGLSSNPQRRFLVMENGLVVALRPEEGAWRLEGLYGLELLARVLSVRVEG
ncbi:MAG: histidine phosphatase family protein [Firmicutes bacterium]|nr:histidine phosphatase family protein [Bacillota bacterium]